MARPAPPRLSLPPRAVWPHLFRAVMWKPVLLGGAVAISLAYDGFNGPEQTLAAGAMAIGCSFALDDPATTTIANSPAPLWWRRTLHLVLVLPLAAVLWLVALGVAGVPAGGAPSAYLEVGAMVAVVLAASAAAARQRGDGLGGTAGAPCLMALTAAATLLPPRWALFPVTGHELRWWLLVAVASGVLMGASRDPAARLRPDQANSIPWQLKPHRAQQEEGP